MGMNEKGPDWWPGGHIRRGKRGDVYVIERRVAGVHFHISTRAHTYTAAMKHLERFEADPSAYRPADNRVALALTPELVGEYRDWQIDVKECTSAWAHNCKRHLADWADDLAGKDLTKLDLQRDVKPALAKRKTSQPHRVIALKGFFRWLRKEKGLLKHQQDVTLDLSIPRRKAQKLSRPRNVTIERVRAIAAHLPAHVKDLVVLLMGTGWHLSEARRFVMAGELVEVNRDGVLAVLITKHKGGRLTRTPLRHVEHLEAAKRMKERKRFLDRNTLGYHMDRAAIAATAATGQKVETFGLGSMRHSVGTWAIEGGARMKDVAEFFDHRSQNTTADFYANAAVPTVSIPVHTLH